VPAPSFRLEYRNELIFQGPSSKLLTPSGQSSAAQLFYEDIFRSVFSGPTFFPVDDLIRSALVFMV
jgi:hypothetical protein